MPGGIGAVSSTVESASTRGDRGPALFANANEIFFHLDGRHVFFDRAGGYLYFVDSPQGVIARTVSGVLAGMAATPVFEQLHLDVHRLFTAARRVALDAAQAHGVLIALRLVGVGATLR